jgi:hypothetical protein
MFRHLIITATLLCLSCPIASAQSVEARNGDIYYLQAGGRAQRLTDTGQDCDPSLSEDRSLVVFVRKTKVAPYEFHPGETQILQSEIWTIEVQSERVQRIVGGPVTFNGRSFSAFHEPQLSPDDRYAYFLVEFAAVTEAIFETDLRSHHSKFVGTAQTFWVVPSGKHSGCLVVRQRRIAPDALSPDYFYWLVDPDGGTIGFVGKDEPDVKSFLATRALRPAPY